MNVQQLETILFPIFDRAPVLMSSAVLPRLYDLADQKSIPRAYVDQARQDYIAQHDALAQLAAAFDSAAPAPSPVVSAATSVAPTEDRIGYLLRTDKTGNLQEVVGPSDPHGYIEAALRKFADNENIAIAILAQMANKQYSLRDTMALDSNLLIAGVLATDPAGRLSPGNQPIANEGVDLSSLPPPQRLRDVMAPGWRLVVPDVPEYA